MTANEAMAEAWASIDGKLTEFLRCREDAEFEEVNGYYAGYITNAAELEKRLLKRGYKVVAVDKGALS